MSRAAGTRASHEGPAMGLKDMQRACFICNGSVYAMVDCADDIFKTFISQITPGHMMKPDVQALLHQRTLDEMDRWFILVTLGKKTTSFSCYQDRQSAEIALRASREALQKKKSQLHVQKSDKPSKHIRSAKLVHA
ncbi:hypothetical protein [Dictyobacter arantiisoli]|uniref:Uncharacterized protein n=1 Tax=Dictyobacter arantiisoli TaxID=2014874 RepID=A0A5A5TLE0_9CHLR|nr:hypothetical protein [Dictyobacter arantiisoli]GCF11784.1 hypothetical protein KDI_53480 [Dictyobacter arantiisoli]